MLLYEVHDGAELSAVMKEAATGPVRICEISPFRTMFRYLADCGLTLFADEHAQLYYKKEGTETAKPSSIQAMMDMCLSKLKEKRSEVSTTFQVECLEEDDRELAMIREDFQKREDRNREISKRTPFKSAPLRDMPDVEFENTQASAMEEYNSRIIGHRGIRPVHREPDLPPHMLI